MKKDLGVLQAVYPMPVLMIATYDEDGKVDVMNAAWGNISAPDKIALFIGEAHKTTKNIRKVKAFAVSLYTELFHKSSSESHPGTTWKTNLNAPDTQQERVTKSMLRS